MKKGYIAKSNAEAIARLRKGLRQTDGKPADQGEGPAALSAKAKWLEARSDQYQWGGVEFSAEELAQYREVYQYLKAHGEPVDCVRPEAIQSKLTSENE